MTDSELLVGLQQKLLDAVASTDWEMYQELCDPSLTAFEPEAKGHLVEGLDFHKFYFDFLKQREGYSSPNNTMSNVKVRMLGADAAVITYIRLQQKVKADAPVTATSEETRVWEFKQGKWVNVHFHRSPCP
eukprot:jgi/Chrzof1/8487/Cz03g12140.t1